MTTITNAGPPPRVEADTTATESVWAYRVDRETTDVPRRAALTWGCSIRAAAATSEDVALSVATAARGAFLTYIGRLHVWVWRTTPAGPDLGPDRVDPNAPTPYYAVLHTFEPGTPPLFRTP